MTLAPKVTTKVTVHSIDDRDIRAACARHLVRADELLRDAEQARLEREWAELTTRIESLLAQAKAIQARGGTGAALLDRVEALERQRTANFNARWPDHPLPHD